MSGVETILAIVGVAVAIPGVVETFIHAGQFLARKIQSEPESPEVVQARKFCVFLTRGTLRSTLETVEDLYCDSRDANFQQQLKTELESIRSLIVQLDENIDNSILHKSTNRGRKASRAVLEDIAALSRVESSLTSFVQAKVAAQNVRSKLELLPKQNKQIGAVTPVLHSSVSLARTDFQTLHRKGHFDCLLEVKIFRGMASEAAYEAARDLARALQYHKFDQGLVELGGFQVIKSGNPVYDDKYVFVFPIPKGESRPRSLRDILLDPVNNPIPPIPRNVRFTIPVWLAEAVYEVHRHNLVHKSIRPESIILFEQKTEAAGGQPAASIGYPKFVGHPHLTDWIYMRRTVDASSMNAANDWVRGLYQHPTRQPGAGHLAEEKYNIGHDIYSLGVCFLEIGLWDSFIRYDGAAYTVAPFLSAAKTQWIADNPQLAPTLQISQIEQQVYLQLARTRLSYEMGEAYSKMVVKCLSCLEKGFGNVTMFANYQSSDWDNEGVLFIQQIRQELSSARIMRE